MRFEHTPCSLAAFLENEFILFMASLSWMFGFIFAAVRWGNHDCCNNFFKWVLWLINLHSSPWFSTACAATIVHRNHFFHLYQKDKSSDSNVKFRQASNRCKRVLEVANLAYANKTKESITSQKLDSRDFWRIANSVLNKGKSAIPLLYLNSEVLSSASDKAKLFAENFSKNPNLDDSGISLPVFHSSTYFETA